MRGIDIFSGVGGMSTGAALAGVRTTLSVEIDPYAAETYAINHPNTKVICADIRTIDFSRYRSDDQTVLFGGPPCQGFSTSNQRTRNSDNPNNWLFTEFLRAIDEINPQWVVFENVKGIAETENAKFLDYVISGLERQDYEVNCAILNAKDFGVPQKRSRLFLVASHERGAFRFPQPSTINPTTVEDAISDLPYLGNGASANLLPYGAKPLSNYAKRMRMRLRNVTGNLVTNNAPWILDRYAHIPQGGNWQDIPVELVKNYKDISRCHTGIYRRLEWGEPSVTIGNFRKNMLVHPNQNRGLSVREAARLQSFPDRYIFSGSIGFQQQQVGNAVPPLLAQAVFSAIVEAASFEQNFRAAAE